MAYRVLERGLPARLGLAKVAELVHDPVVDHLQRHLGLTRLAHRQYDQLRVGVGRLDHRVGAAATANAIAAADRGRAQ